MKPTVYYTLWYLSILVILVNRYYFAAKLMTVNGFEQFWFMRLGHSPQSHKVVF